MNPIIMQVVVWFLEKALIHAGKEVDWQALKLELQTKLDDILPGVIYDKIANYLVGVLIDMVANYFAQSSVPVTPEVVHSAIENASNSLLGKVAADFLDIKGL